MKSSVTIHAESLRSKMNDMQAEIDRLKAENARLVDERRQLKQKLESMTEKEQNRQDEIDLQQQIHSLSVSSSVDLATASKPLSTLASASGPTSSSGLASDALLQSVMNDLGDE